MKLLISTTKTQGQLPTDFNHTQPSEPLYFGSECDRDESWDGSCGCRRALCGVRSAGGTTTFEVADFSREEYELYIEALVAHYEYRWKKTEAVAHQEAAMQVFDIAEVAAPYPVGTVLERREEIFLKRNNVKP